MGMILSFINTMVCCGWMEVSDWEQILHPDDYTHQCGEHSLPPKNFDDHMKDLPLQKVSPRWGWASGVPCRPSLRTSSWCESYSSAAKAPKTHMKIKQKRSLGCFYRAVVRWLILTNLIQKNKQKKHFRCYEIPSIWKKHISATWTWVHACACC